MSQQHTDNAAQKSKCKRSYFILGLFILIFIGPIIVALSLYSSRSYIPEAISYGHLIQPPIQLENLPLLNAENKPMATKDLYGHWLMLYISPRTCNKLCENNLYKMRQIRKATGKHQLRVERVILTLTNQNTPTLAKLLQSDYQGTIHIKAKKSALSQFLQHLPSKELALKQGTLYLVDPLGNVMMSYKPDQKPKGILADLKRLLKASQIG
jgi:cytochrome oxidase Cu insertion factor (SCO1/SenC/PrrC family)